MNRLRVVVEDWAHVLAQQVRAVGDRTPPDAFASGSRVPLVLLPGIWEPWRYLLPLARRLHRLGHPVHPLPGLGWNGRPLDDSLALVRDGLAALGLHRPVLVAHSKGGLIGKALLVDAVARGGGGVGGGCGEGDGDGELGGVDGDFSPCGLVAVCTPFGGSPLSLRPLARTPLGLFAPGHAGLLALAAERAVNSRIVSIGSAWDEMIPTGSHLAGAHNVTLRMPGHFRPVSEQGTARVVSDWAQRLASGAG